jgi:hypothetical protein
MPRERAPDPRWFALAWSDAFGKSSCWPFAWKLAIAACRAGWKARHRQHRGRRHADQAGDSDRAERHLERQENDLDKDRSRPAISARKSPRSRRALLHGRRCPPTACVLVRTIRFARRSARDA